MSDLKKSTSENIYIATKTGQRLRPYLPEGYNLKTIETFVNRSLKNLGVENIDLLQLHCPPPEICSNKELYEMMDELVKKGKISFYGISVFSISEAISIKYFELKLIFKVSELNAALIFSFPSPELALFTES